MLSSGPPELPGLIDASVWMKSVYVRSSVRSERPTALTTPVVTVCERPKGLPIAITVSPIMRSAAEPKGMCGRSSPALTRTMAMSASASAPTSVASNSRWSASVTWMRLARSITCTLVMMVPSAATMTPEPRLVVLKRRGAGRRSRGRTPRRTGPAGRGRASGAARRAARSSRAPPPGSPSRPPRPPGSAAPGRSPPRAPPRRRGGRGPRSGVPPSSPSVASLLAVREREVNLPALDRDPDDQHADRVAHAERPPRAPAAQQVLALDVIVEVVAERAHVHQALDEDVPQLDEEAERHHTRDEAVVGLAHLVLHELDLLQRDDLALGLHRHALAPRGLLGDGAQVGRHAPGAEDAVHDQVGIAADGRGEVGVAGGGEAEVAECLRRVARLLHGTEEDGVDETLLGTSLHLLEDGGERLGRRAPLLHPQAEPEALEEASQLGLALRGRRLVHAVEEAELPARELARHGLVGGEHELLDHLVRDGTLGAHDVCGPAAEVEHHLGLGEVEVDGAPLPAAGHEQARQRLGALERLDQGVEGGAHRRVAVDQRLPDLGVGEARGAPHAGVVEGDRGPLPARVELHADRLHQTVLVGLETADAVRQLRSEERRV